MKKINPSVKHHLLIGILLAIWLFLFAFLIRPFDDGTINFKNWILISVGFSIISFLSYALLSVIQQKVYQKKSTWNIGLEITSLIFFQLLFCLGTFTYYKSPILKGGYDFLNFVQTISLKLALISTPVIILARIYLVRLIPAEIPVGAPVEDENIIIRGENKLDFLKIKKDNLICVSNAQNYVDIFFIDDNQLKTKVIRSTLKKVQEDFDFLIQIHRSHLINPTHFKAWKDQNTISVTQMELPVSKSYKDSLMSL